jgi:hypothetical protein
VIDCIVVDLWESNLDTNGGFLENSTAFQIVDHFSAGVMIDYERENRYNGTRKVETINAHPYVFQRFCKSIRFKYILEMLICGGLAFIFQYYITNYISETNAFFSFGVKHVDV